MSGILTATIIVPIRNEFAHIESGLYAILAQDYPADQMEILIVDGMSTDNTRKVINDFISLHPQLDVHILDNPDKIVPTGMNIAVRRARGEVIIRVDGHTLIAPDYVRQCIEILIRTHADNVGGRMNAAGRTPFGKAVVLATSTPFGIGGGRFHYSDTEEWVDTVYMGAWPRRVFEKIGLFDEELVRDQDDEFNYRLREQGGRILLAPDIRSEYTVRSTPRSLWSQYYQYGFWKVRVMQKHPRQMSLRQFVPPVFVLTLLLGLFIRFSSPGDFLALHMVAGVYLLANLGVSLWTASRRGWPALLYLPLVFVILHLSYGLGFLAGLVKFANRWGDRHGMTPAIGDP